MRHLILASLFLGAAVAAEAQYSPSEQGRFLKDSATAFVLENARLIDGTGGPAFENVTVVTTRDELSMSVKTLRHRPTVPNALT